MNNSLVVINASSHPLALRNAIGKYSLTPAQVEDLAYGLEISEMHPSSAIKNLKIMSPEKLACCLALRADFVDEDQKPSINVIAKAIDKTNYPTDGSVPSALDIDAVLHEIVKFGFTRSINRVTEDFEIGGYKIGEVRVPILAYSASRGWGETEYDHQDQGEEDDYDD